MFGKDNEYCRKTFFTKIIKSPAELIEGLK